MTPVDRAGHDPITEKRNWRSTAFLTLATLAFAAVAIWWFGIRDASGPVTIDPISVTVTGTEPFGVPVEVAEDTMLNRVNVASSDARLTGVAEVTFSVPMTPVVTWVITNEGGSWKGAVASPPLEIPDPPGSAWVGTMDGVLLGAGDYDGLHYRFHGWSADGIYALAGTLESIGSEADMTGTDGTRAVTSTLAPNTSEADPTVTFDGTTATYEGPGAMRLDADQFTTTAVNDSEQTAFFIVREVAPDFWGIEAHRSWLRAYGPHPDFFRGPLGDSVRRPPPTTTSAMQYIEIGPGESQDWSISLSGQMVFDVADIDTGYSAALINVNP